MNPEQTKVVRELLEKHFPAASRELVIGLAVTIVEAVENKATKLRKE